MSAKCPNCGFVFEPGPGEEVAESAAVPYESMTGPVTALAPDGQQVVTNASALEVANRPGWEVLAPGDQTGLAAMPDNAATLVALLRQQQGLGGPMSESELDAGLGVGYAPPVRRRPVQDAQAGMAQALRRR